MTSSLSFDAEFEVRLQSIKRVVRDVTAKSLKFAADTSTSPLPTQNGAGDNEYNIYGTGDDSNVEYSFDVNMGGEDESGSDNNASGKTRESDFDLSMTLFGDDPKAIEEDLHLRLSKAEDDLNACLGIGPGGQHQQDENSSPIVTQHPTAIDYESFGVTPAPSSGDVDPAIKQHILQQEAGQLRSKITFLRKCCEARVALDEANALSLQLSCATRTGLAAGGTSRKAAASMVSIDAAHNLTTAQSALKEALHLIAENSNMTERDAKVAKSIVQSIQSQITRKTVDLHNKATALIDSCITLTQNSIAITQGPNMPARKPNAALNDSTNSSGASINVSTSSSPVEVSKSVPLPSHQGLQAAIEVLAILSEGSSYNRLEVKMQNIADDFAAIIRPVIVEARDAMKDGRKPKRLQIDEFCTNGSKSSVGSKLQSNIGVLGRDAKDTIFTLGWREIDDKSKYDDDDRGLEWWKDLLNFLQTTIKFFCEKALSQGVESNRNVDLLPMFGHAFLGQAAASPTKSSYSLPFESDIMEHGIKCPIVKLLDRLLWEFCIPESPISSAQGDLGKIKSTVTDSVLAFESFLLDSRLITNHTVLQDYAIKFDDKYNEKVRSSILVKGRRILLKGDYHDSVKVGLNIHEQKKAERPEYLDHIDVEQNDLSLFLFQECGVSKVATQLMSLCKDTMDLAVDPNVSSDALLSATLYRASRELLDLFRASIHAVHGSDIATIPRTAAIFHNDCTFFAHKMLSFGLIYRDQFPVGDDGKESHLKQICTFLDLVPLFRDLAERTMNDMIQFQKHQISEIAGPRLTYLGDALRSNEGVVEWSDAETALTAGLYHLRHLSQAWESMLSRDIYNVTIGSIVDELFNLFLVKVLGAKDISVPACHFVSGLFQNVLRGVSDLFGSPEANSNSGPEAAQYCTLHRKFSAVGKFMDMSLVDINRSLSEGLFRSVTGAELSRLVCAVFEDSESRRNLLRLLESN